MKTLIIVIFSLFASLASAQAPRPRLMCKFENGYFRVSDGIKKWERYIGLSSNPMVDCGSDYGIGAAGPYFVTFWEGQITQTYVGGNGARSFLLRGHMGIAVMGSYLLVAKAGGPVIQKYLSGNAEPVIQASSAMALLSYGSYLLATDGITITEKYVGTVTNPILSVGREVAGALLGSYFLVYVNGQIQDDYVGSRYAHDMVVAGRQSAIVAAAVGSNFIVYDVQRNVTRQSYTGAGKVEVREDGAYHWSATSNRITRYNPETGAFENL